MVGWVRVGQVVGFPMEDHERRWVLLIGRKGCSTTSGRGPNQYHPIMATLATESQITEYGIVTILGLSDRRACLPIVA